MGHIQYAVHKSYCSLPLVTHITNFVVAFTPEQREPAVSGAGMGPVDMGWAGIPGYNRQILDTFRHWNRIQ